MPDVFSDLEAIDNDTVEMIGNILEARAGIPSQQVMTNAYLDQISFPHGARAIELGCGTGPVCRAIAARPEVSLVVGLDPSGVLLSRARAITSDQSKISYEQGDAYDVSHETGSFDLVVVHTLLTHLDDPAALLSEARRLVRDDGWLAVCDGDFSTASVALEVDDPLQRCVEAFVEANVTDPYLVRHMSALVAGAGFKPGPVDAYGLVETLGPALTISWIDRGATVLETSGRITAEVADGYRNEANARVDAGTWFGYMAYASLIARPI